jgi:hypothetical protein
VHMVEERGYGWGMWMTSQRGCHFLLKTFVRML